MHKITSSASPARSQPQHPVWPLHARASTAHPRKSRPLSAAQGLGARPARFRRPRLLIVGCGDIGLRLAQRAVGWNLRALTSSPPRQPLLRAHGLTPLLADLDQPATLRRLAGIATHVLHLVPPPSAPGAAHSKRDPRSRHLLQALRKRGKPPVLVYGSTSGVYGDCAGRWIDESHTIAPQTPRAQRRAHAEQLLRSYGRTSGARCSILRIPGIYASDRAGGTPRERLLKGSPVLCAADDVYTNHIQADDLARALRLALWRAAPQRIYNACDDSELKMGDYFDQAADHYGLPRPPRVSRAQAAAELSPMQLSFMGESRRLRNRRLKQELRLRLLYPQVIDGLSR
jgi:nucleoside-diphosphate-sugar epimerase